MYCQQTKNIITLVHGYDFVSSGYQEGLELLHDKMKKRFKVSKNIVGRDKEAKVRNRIIRVSSSGWEYEADQRHGEILIKALNMEHANPVG